VRPTVAVVGASLAGLSAARALRAQSYEGRVVNVGDERHASYDRPPLSKQFLAGTASADDLALGVPDDAALELDWRLGTLDDVVALRADLVPGAHLVVIGAGFVGAEVASTARGLGLEVTVVESLPVHEDVKRGAGEPARGSVYPRSARMTSGET